MRSRKSRRKQRSALLGSRSDTCVVQTRSQRSRAGLAPGHKLTTVGHCARLCGRTCSVLGCCFASHLGNLCTFATVLWSVRAHTQRYAHMHAVCRGLWLSRGARASRACDSACVLCDCSSYVRGWARAELGSTFEPCHVSGCLEHAKTHRNRLVVVVFSQSIVQSSRSDPPSPLPQQCDAVEASESQQSSCCQRPSTSNADDSRKSEHVCRRVFSRSPRPVYDPRSRLAKARP